MHQVEITVADCEAVSGLAGLQGMIAGLRLMKTWADAHAPGYKYQGSRQRFQFRTAADLARFSATFLHRASAESPLGEI